jgi:hypothetical protein
VLHYSQFWKHTGDSRSLKQDEVMRLKAAGGLACFVGEAERVQSNAVKSFKAEFVTAAAQFVGFNPEEDEMCLPRPTTPNRMMAAVQEARGTL